MNNSPLFSKCIALLVAAGCAFSALAQPTTVPPGRGMPDGGGDPGFGGGGFGPGDFGPGGFGRGGPGGFGGRGGGGPGGGGVQEDLKLVKQFDKDVNGRLNAEERKAAREYVTQQMGNRGRGGGRRGGPGGGFGGSPETSQPGPKLTPADVKSFPGASLYDALTLRTFFLEFENSDWEKELIAFHRTDVEVPAKLTVDGKVYPDVGVHFHGMSSFMSVGEGQKHSMVLSMDFAHPDQQIGGYHTLNLLNSHEDPSFLRTVLSMQVARDYMPAPKANFARVVINGESWGVYVNQQHFNKEFINDNYSTTKGARWKVPGSPNARGSLAYLGDDPAPYKRIYEIKTKDESKPWNDFIKLCRVLNQTPTNELEKALAPILDIDGTLRYLAWDNALINGDGYWTRTSDYDIYEDPSGKFHIIPYDANETFSSGGGGPGGPGGRGRRGGPGGPGDGRGRGFGPGGQDGFGGPPDFGGGPGFGQGPGGDFGPGAPGGPGGGFAQGGRGGGGGGPRGGGGITLDPLVDANNSGTPLLAKLLAVPALRARYIAYVHDMAEKWLDWGKLGPIAEKYHTLIEADVKTDTRKLDSAEAFENSLSQDTQTQGQRGFGGPGGGSIRSFAEKRRAYLLSIPVPGKEQ